MKKQILAAVLCVWSAWTAQQASAFEWREEKGDHFIVYYTKEEAFAKDVRRNAETYYTRIANDLGYTRFNFWQWDNRVKIYIYPSEKDYQKATGQPDWSKGEANYETKSISTFEWNKEFNETLLPHEIAHLIFRDFVGFKGEVPLWLDEGVAQWQEPATRDIARQAGYTVVAKRVMFPFAYFMSIYSLKGRDDETVQYFYMQALSVVDFLIRRHGLQSFSEFCRQLRDGRRLEDALKATYPASISNLKDLEKNWMEYVTST